MTITDDTALNDNDNSNDNGPCTQLDTTPKYTDATATKQTPSGATFCLGVERSFSDPKGTVLEIAKPIHRPDEVVSGDDGVPNIVNLLWMDRQVKYNLLARGEVQYFV
ncbi:hypothetical protein ACHAXS_000360 [Conticribra weissflogii]